MAEPVSYLIPNLGQGISQQPDAQRDPSQGEVQVNAVSSAADGLRKREGTRVVARLSTTPFTSAAAFHQIQRDANEQYLVVITTAAIRVFGLDGVEKTVTAASGAMAYLASVQNAQTDIRAATVADYTFISNVRTAPAMAAALAPAVARPSAHEALVWVKAANYGQTYRVVVNGTVASVQTAVAPVVVNSGTTTENRISAAEVAENIKVALAGVTGVTITRGGSVLHLRSSSAITIEATDARANADITAITGSVQSFTELPAIAPQGYQVEVQGDPSNRFDGYYVQFVPQPGAGTFGEGTWEETVAPGVKYQLDAATMPHLLVRLANGNFWFGPANGSTQSGTKIPAWGQRTAGDEDSAADPSFIGNPIQDVFVFRNRLGFLADENIILSRARDFFEFFPETVTASLDSDPIDQTASNSRVSVLRYAVPYQDELIVFSDQLQFRFSSSDAVLAPATAQITVLTQYEADKSCRPIAAQGAIVFAQANGQWSQFREFSVRGAGTALVADAVDLTAHVSGYVPSSVSRLTGNDTDSTWFALSSKEGYQKRLYCYKYFVRSTGAGLERAQASWSHWEFLGVSRILDVVCVRQTLFLLVERGCEVWLEKLAVADRMTNVLPAPYPLLLDRAVSTTTETPTALRVAPGVYSAATGLTTWTLPWTMRATTQAWSGYSPTTNGGVLLGQASSGSTITARGDWSASTWPIWFGEPYTFRYRFTRFKLYKTMGNGLVAANVMRTQVRHAKLRYHASRFFKVLVQAEGREAATYVFDGTILNSRDTTLGSALPAVTTQSVIQCAVVGPLAGAPEGVRLAYTMSPRRVAYYVRGTETRVNAPVNGGGTYTANVIVNDLWFDGYSYMTLTTPPVLEFATPGTTWGYSLVQWRVVITGVDQNGSPITRTTQWYQGVTGTQDINVFPNETNTAGQTSGGNQLNIMEPVTAPDAAEPGPDRFQGVFRIPVASRGENCIVEIQNDTPHPCQFSSCEWVGLVTGQARSLQ